MSANSRINRQTLTEDAAAERAASRAATISKALADTDGSDAAHAEKDKAKRNLLTDNEGDLRENR